MLCFSNSRKLAEFACLVVRFLDKNTLCHQAKFRVSGGSPKRKESSNATLFSFLIIRYDSNSRKLAEFACLVVRLLGLKISFATKLSSESPAGHFLRCSTLILRREQATTLQNFIKQNTRKSSAQQYIKNQRRIYVHRNQ